MQYLLMAIFVSAPQVYAYARERACCIIMCRVVLSHKGTINPYPDGTIISLYG